MNLIARFTPLYRLLLSLLLSGLITASSTAQAEPFAYEAAALPEESTPHWKKAYGEGTATLSDGVLTVSCPPDKRHYYALGVFQDGAGMGEGGTWDATSGKATIDFKLKCNAEDETTVVFSIILRDGETQWEVYFRAGKINGVFADTRDWDVYRLTLNEGKMELSSESRGVIIPASEGTPDHRGNLIYFGSYSYRPDFSGPDREWSIEYLRWNNQEALPAYTAQ